MKRNADGTIANASELMVFLNQMSGQTDNRYLREQIEKAQRVIRDSEILRIQMDIARAHKSRISAVSGSVATNYDPPAIAEFSLTILATTRSADAMIGDLNERFARECREFGRDRAVRLYWARTLRSLGPLLWRAIGKVVRWGVVLAVLRRLF
jgi:hypothetical protein